MRPDELRRCTCGAPIRWATSVHGNPMPLEAEPAADGTVELERTRGMLVGRVLVALDLELARLERRPLYRSHFADCPDAERHRRPRVPA